MVCSYLATTCIFIYICGIGFEAVEYSLYSNIIIKRTQPVGGGAQTFEQRLQYFIRNRYKITVISLIVADSINV